MRFKKFINENELRNKSIEIKKKEFNKMGLKFYNKWDSFIKNNKKEIDNEVEKIKKNVSIIKDEKLRDKKFKDEMRDFKNKLTELWGAMK